MMDLIAARAYEIIQACPGLDIYDAVEMARREIHDEAAVRGLLTGGLLVVAAALLLVGWVK